MPADSPGLGALLSPFGMALALAWNFIVLASMQLTIRLIRIFSVRTTLLAALAQTPAFLVVAAMYWVWLGARPDLYLLPALLMALVGFGVARWILRVRRTRGQVVAAIGVALLAGPWPVFLVALPR